MGLLQGHRHPEQGDVPPVGTIPPRRGRLLRRAARRLPAYVLTVFLAATVNFAIPRLMPGDPTALILGEDAARLQPEEVKDSLRRFGLDQALPEQYARYLANLARGDLGYSYANRRPVTDLMRERLPWTVLLVGTAFVASTLVGVCAGLFAAWGRQRRAGAAAVAGFVTLESTPAFWIGILLLILFGARLHWLPVFGPTSLDSPQGLAGVREVARHLVLPAVTLTLAWVGGTFLLARAASVGVVRDDFILIARAKGLRERAIAVRHALPAASLPIVTALLLRSGALVGASVGGAIVVETVFSYPGVGKLTHDAALGRDYPVLQGCFLVLTLMIVVANFVGDMLYPRLDPRVGSGR